MNVTQLCQISCQTPFNDLKYYSVAIFFSYALQFYVVMDIIGKLHAHLVFHPKEVAYSFTRSIFILKRKKL
jgi:hypothetical protein